MYMNPIISSYSFYIETVRFHQESGWSLRSCKLRRDLAHAQVTKTRYSLSFLELHTSLKSPTTAPETGKIQEIDNQTKIQPWRDSRIVPYLQSIEAQSILHRQSWETCCCDYKRPFFIQIATANDDYDRANSKEHE